MAAHDILSIEGKNLARHCRKRDIEVDLQLLLCFTLVKDHLAHPSPLHKHRKLREKKVDREGDSATRNSSARKRGLCKVSRNLAVKVKTLHSLHPAPLDYLATAANVRNLLSAAHQQRHAPPSGASS